MEWDDEVDVLCTGSGVGGLATAIAAVDAGVDVFVADSLGLDVGDDETNQYFDELSQDLCIPVHRAPRDRRADHGERGSGACGIDIPASRALHRLPPADWAASCVASPYGFLYSGVAERTAVTMRSSRGESFEVAAVGSIELGPGPAAGGTCRLVVHTGP